MNEIFYTLQGEGARAGTPAVFLRFAKCNLACNRAEHGFDCDTDFEHGDWFDLDGLRAAVSDASERAEWIVLTGGEPALQIDTPLIHALHRDGYKLAIETNGTFPLPVGLDWVCVSPKPGAATVVTEADEVKFVIPAGGTLPLTSITADHYLLSPAADGDTIDPAALATCVALCLEHPPWRLSCQQHKWWGVR